MKISFFFGTALGTRIFEHLYLSAGPLCGWPGYIDGYFCLCVYMHKPRRASLSDGYCLFVADRCCLLTQLKAQWKERLFVEIPLFATRLLRWSPLLRVIVHGVTSIDWTDWNIFPAQTVFFRFFYLAYLSGITKYVCMARHHTRSITMSFFIL